MYLDVKLYDKIYKNNVNIYICISYKFFRVFGDLYMDIVKI